jgi:hypothetical protein
VWPDGRKYHGEYLVSVKHGTGIFEWPDGRKYIGQWQDGVQHGRGIYITVKGRRFEGEWKNGELEYWHVDGDKKDDDTVMCGSIAKDILNPDYSESILNPNFKPLGKVT